MHVVAIHSWRKEDPGTAQTVADALGILLFEARQRLAGGGPVVVATFAERPPAEALRTRLEQGDIPSLLIDTKALHTGAEPLPAKLFWLDESELRIETVDGEQRSVSYPAISLLVPATTVVGRNQSTAPVTERKFSLGKTVLAGGIPMTKKVKQEVKLSSEERDEVLYLAAAQRPVFLFRRGALNYSGLGTAMQMSRELNFTFLKTELRRRAPQAIYDDRLLKRPAQVRLLGTSLDPDANLGLAFEILARAVAETGQGG